MSLSPRRDQQRQFWLRIQAGKLREEAATDIGLHSATGERWFSQAGGVIPAYILKPPGPRYLLFAEREEIFAGWFEGDRAVAVPIVKSNGGRERQLLAAMAHHARPVDHQCQRERRVGMLTGAIGIRQFRQPLFKFLRR